MSDNSYGRGIDDDSAGDDSAGDDSGAAEISAADERALRAMFAALVEDAGPSELSPLAVQRAARAEQVSTSARRVTRVKYIRNVLIAAVLAGVVVLVLPHLVSTSQETATAASSSSAAAAATSAAAAAPAASAGGDFGASTVADRAVPLSSAAGSNVPASGAAPLPAGGGSAGAASSGGESTSAAAGVVPGRSTSAASSAMSSGAMSSAPASSAAATSASSTTDLGCPAIAGGALAAVHAALPGYRGEVQVFSCSVQVRSPSAAAALGTVTFVVSRTGSPACVRSGTDCPAVPGTRIPGTQDAYSYSTDIVVAGSRGVTVTITSPPGGPDRSALIAAARVLLTNVG